VAELLKGAGYRTAMIGKSCVTGNTQDGRGVELRAEEEGQEVAKKTDRYPAGSSVVNSLLQLTPYPDLQAHKPTGM